MNPKRACAIVSAVVATSLLVGSAIAVPKGKNVTFKGGGLGKVVFSGTAHAKSAACTACHPKVFKMKSGASKITMKDIYAGKFCGTCHNGKKAFAAKPDCQKCHKK